ncbi:hypothetical protein [Geosporobacter ferrireducens]|nr:hypothetical protein [Geosporobacter ferrireducens]
MMRRIISEFSISKDKTASRGSGAPRLHIAFGAYNTLLYIQK